MIEKQKVFIANKMFSGPPLYVSDLTWDFLSKHAVVLPLDQTFILGRRFNLQHTFDYFLHISRPNVVMSTQIISLAKAFPRIELAISYARFWREATGGPDIQVLLRPLFGSEMREQTPLFLTRRTTVIRRTDLIVADSLPHFLPRHRS